MAHMKVTIWLRRKTGAYLTLVFAGSEIFLDDLADKVGGCNSVIFAHKAIVIPEYFAG